MKILSKELALKNDINQDLESRLEKAQSVTGRHMTDFESKLTVTESGRLRYDIFFRRGYQPRVCHTLYMQPRDTSTSITFSVTF